MKPFGIAAALASLVSCSSSAAPPASPTPPIAEPATAAGAPETAAAEPDDAELEEVRFGHVEVLDAGAEPRQTLRFSFTPHTEYRRRLELQLHTRFDSGQGPEIESFALALVIRAEPGEALRDGSRWVTYTVESIDALTDMPAQEVADAIGAAYRERWSPAGESLEYGVTALGQMSQSDAEAMVETLRKVLRVRLPEQDIGVGASWNVVDGNRDVIPTVLLPSSTTYTLVAVDGDAVTLDVAIEMSVEAIQPAAEPGATPMWRIERLDARGSGRIEVDLTQALPTSSEVNRSADVILTLADGPSTRALYHREAGSRIGAP